jgi:hypothetical protein
MIEPIETRVSNFQVVKIYQDECYESPREWCNLGHIVYTSDRYTLGDERLSAEDIQVLVDDDDIVSFPVYAYIHGGVALSLTPFSCSFDSGQCGIIYARKADIISEVCSEMTPCEMENRVYKIFEAEIKVFNEYLNGEVYYVESNGETIGGVYASGLDDAINELTRG